MRYWQMSLSKVHLKWARDAGTAFAAAEDAESALGAVGFRLRELFPSVDAMREAGLYDELRGAFADAYVASGKDEANVSGNWARILYQYAFPGTGKCSGKFYKMLEDGSTALDKERNLPTPPPSAAKTPRLLRGMPFLEPSEVVDMAGFPLRLIVAAGSGGGKTVFVRQMLETMLEENRLDFALVMTGTLTSQWDDLGPKVEVLEFSGDYSRLHEVVAAQKDMVRDAPKAPETWLRPLVLLDDLGPEKSARKGDGGQIIDELFLVRYSPIHLRRNHALS